MRDDPTLRAKRLAAILAFAPSVVLCQEFPPRNVVPGAIPGFACDAPGLDAAEQARCRARELRFHDLRLNARYQELRKVLEAEVSAALIKTQQEWVLRRDSRCDLAAAPSERDDWLVYVSASSARVDCVLGMTRERIAQMEKLFPEPGVQAFAKVVPQGVAGKPDPGTPVAEDVLARSTRSRRGGKYYFEVVVDRGQILDPVEAEIVARVSDGKATEGMSYRLRPENVVLQLGPGSGGVTIVGGNLGTIRLPKVVLGVAVDLDAGRLYRHRNGTWEDDISPGHPGAKSLPRDVEFVAQLAASAAAKPLVEEGILWANFGDKPFERQPPAGYVAFDAPDSSRQALAANQLLTFAPGERVAGTTQVEWIQRYWEWVRSFPPADSPSRDDTGYRCGMGQSGPVWFLTGSREPKAVHRECEIPEGKVLLVPIVNALTQVTPGKDAGCETLLVALGQFAPDADALRLKMNGSELGNPERYLQKTGCFTLRDAGSGQSGLASGSGYWVFIKPLTKGRYELEFGGTYPNTRFQQNIRYSLHVR